MHAQFTSAERNGTEWKRIEETECIGINQMQIAYPDKLHRRLQGGDSDSDIGQQRSTLNEKKKKGAHNH